jgi:hypothetical protein
MRADVRDAPDPPLLVQCDLSWEESHATAFHWVTGPSVVRLDAADNVSAVLRSRRVGCRHRPACGRRMLRLRRANRSGLGCFSPWPWGDRFETLHVDCVDVKGWRLIATNDKSKLRSFALSVNDKGQLHC